MNVDEINTGLDYGGKKDNFEEEEEYGESEVSEESEEEEVVEEIKVAKKNREKVDPKNPHHSNSKFEHSNSQKSEKRILTSSVHGKIFIFYLIHFHQIFYLIYFHL